MKVYRVNQYLGDGGATIEILEAERKTDMSVWIDGRRYGICSDWYRHFFTLENAIGYCRRKAIQSIQDHENKVRDINADLEEAEKFYQTNKQLEEEGK